MLKYAIAAAALAAATIAVAHEGETNPVILARMEAMKAIGDSTKTLGQMAKGEVAFDAGKAQAAAQAIAAEAEKIPALFEAEAISATSESLPAIWQKYPDFTAKAEELTTAAASAKISGPDDLGPALGAIGKTCKGCHTDYRAEN